MTREKIIIDTEQFQRTISRISHQIIEKHGDLQDVVIVGIKRRGAEIAELIQKRIEDLAQTRLPYMALDITFYRDDLDLIYQDPVFMGADNQLNLNGKKVILVDDVLFTGRTIRAALDALLDFGRAARIELVIFVDRGHRELPIRADYVGKNIPTAKNEQIQVQTLSYDGINQVVLVPAANKESA
ncbi:TPA: bifunctional pyr operon transcriptional regulator/uracil phosphoribosyltransferase PyrR [Mannheimia haemolytica]|uniref:Bifunctional protein PyrR n=1 Tax=Mannheimia haemolytica TaxID=75985 RepID=A0A378NAP9_MANHA|nr:bifunctional pyr operon transcriptional regulator/uracil phosphoribosyltransferase PyrR [Mannheimia haemolytica]AGQ39664.1 uracil phosphoribosyltransferase [Mannheimia haemolytica D171]EEY10521.1 uracil phosphoribosyltransferase [Mannheimia haemolytica serotype A2 str. OVINE]EEY11710.1 uracil phosphoribosyltransferase [Mannheimia haemolytica serotype A2 str. BOVINE]KYL09893.1 uracil phosphoribosyltransferase [Mannheimia haemolytica]KYL17839.1 uracil phosphoribosyltransferase [Mannheimia hae